MTSTWVPWDFALILLFLAIIVPWRGSIRVRELLARAVVRPSDRISMYGSTIGFQWAAVAFTLWRIKARTGNAPFPAAALELAIPHPIRAVAAGATLALAIATSQILSLRALSRMPVERRGELFELTRKLMPHSTAESLPFLALVSTVSLCEEFLYRGFAFVVIGGMFAHSVAAAIIGSSALFAIGHLYQGRRGLSTTFVLGLMLASVRYWTGSLLPCMIAHFVTDLVAGFAGSRTAVEEAPHTA